MRTPQGLSPRAPLLLPLLPLLLALLAGAGAEPAPPAAAGPRLPPAAAPPPDSDAEADDASGEAEAEAEWLREADSALLADYLSQALRQGWAGPGSGPAAAAGHPPLPVAMPLPVLYLDEEAGPQQQQQQQRQQDTAAAGPAWKRSRYYRRYPWKRQPGRGGGLATDADNPYLCNPTREDVFQLLVALHEARAGNLGRTVSFCNRRRPAAAVFTNIRFLGRRRR